MSSVTAKAKEKQTLPPSLPPFPTPNSYFYKMKKDYSLCHDGWLFLL